MRITRHPQTGSIFFHFESTHEYADTVERECRARHLGSWTGETWGESITRARSGNTALVPQAEALVDKLTVEAQRDQPIWIPSVAGAFPCVGDYLAGAPDCMRRRHPTPTDRAPIKMYVELTSSAGVSASDMVKRGTAILALALLLNSQRSIELSVIVGLGSGLARTTGDDGGCFVVVPLGASPLDIALSCNALTSVGFVRGMGYEFLSHRAESRANGGWAWGIMPSGSERIEYVRRLRMALDLTETDIIVPPIFMHDETVTNPLGFVQRSLNEALKVEQDAE